MVAGTRIANPSRPPGRPRVPADLVSAVLVSPVQVDLVREAARRSPGLDLNSVSPVDAPLYPNVRTIVQARGFVALPTLPLGLKTNAVPDLVLLVVRLPTLEFRQPASKRYPPLRSEEPTDARPLLATTLTAALWPLFPRRASLTLRFPSANVNVNVNICNALEFLKEQICGYLLWSIEAKMVQVY